MRLANDFPLAGYDWASRVQIGTGGFGKVYKVKSTKAGGTYVAIKQLDTVKYESQQMMEYLRREIDLMTKLKSQYIIQLIEHYIGKPYTYVVMQMCEGDVRSLMTKSNGKLPQETCVEIYCQIMQGFKVITDHGYIHRDVKPDNILYNGKSYKVSDLGIARQVQIKGNAKFMTLIGTVPYEAPQLLEGNPYTSKCDIWSLGLMLYEMIYGYFPWVCMNRQSYLSAIYKQPLSFPYNISVGENLKDFIRKCLVIDEKKRISWDQIFKHPLINKKNPGQKSKIVPVNQNALKIMRHMQESAARKNINILEVFRNAQNALMSPNTFYDLCSRLDPSVSAAEAQMLFNYFDSNKDGLVSFAQFSELYTEYDFRDGEDIVSRFIREVVEAAKVQSIDLQKLFAKYDRNKDKQLSIGEFMDLIRAIMPGINTDNILKIFHKLDKDGWGTISIGQFMEVVIKKTSRPQPEGEQQKNKLLTNERAHRNLKALRGYIKDLGIAQKDLFVLFDRDRNGKIDMKEFKRLVCGMMDALPDDQIKEMFEFIDKDHNGSISSSELQSYLAASS